MNSATCFHCGADILPVSGFRAEILGPVKAVKLEPNANRRVDFLVKVAPVPAAERDIELHLIKDGKIMAVAPMRLLVK